MCAYRDDDRLVGGLAPTPLAAAQVSTSTRQARSDPVSSGTGEDQLAGCHQGDCGRRLRTSTRSSRLGWSARESARVSRSREDYWTSTLASEPSWEGCLSKLDGLMRDLIRKRGPRSRSERQWWMDTPRACRGQSK